MPVTRPGWPVKIYTQLLHFWETIRTQPRADEPPASEIPQMRQLTKERLERPDSRNMDWKCWREQMNRTVPELRGEQGALQWGGPTRSSGLWGSESTLEAILALQKAWRLLLAPWTHPRESFRRQRRLNEQYAKNTAQLLYFVHLWESSSSTAGEMPACPRSSTSLHFLIVSELSRSKGCVTSLWSLSSMEIFNLESTVRGTLGLQPK